ncbi:3-deoxy-D-manno-octulosonic acid transferase [Aliiroseovarius marinus]|uniref:3-deoxy-D-manno-octulosonic acid transferase n=1 Tax=Aliiroseovarius marinus TaxID=2500159 RepID=UPI003D7C5E52
MTPPAASTLFRSFQGLVGLEKRLDQELADGLVDPDGARQRLGEASRPRPEGDLIWAHLDTAGAVPELVGLYNALLDENPDLHLLITSEKTLDSKELPRGSFFQHAPYFASESMDVFLNHWTPQAALWMAAEMTPTVTSGLSARRIGVVWINAIAPRESLWQRHLMIGQLKQSLSRFVSIVPRSETDLAAFLRLGVAQGKLLESGPLQPQIAPPACDMDERDRLAQKLQARPVWLALRADPAELPSLLAAHRLVSRKSHRLLLILSLTDPSEGARVAAELENEHWQVALRSRSEDPDRDCQILIADGEEECALWMHIAPITFAGGSLASGSDVQPLEPAGLGSVVLYGNAMGRHKDAFRRLSGAGAARRVRDVNTLAREIEHLLAPDRAAKMAMAAWELTTSGAETCDRLRDTVLQIVDDAVVEANS